MSFVSTLMRAFRLDSGRLRRDGRFVLFMSKGGLGDAFCQTGLMRAMLAVNPALRFVIVTRHPTLFSGHPAVAELVDVSAEHAWIRVLVHARLRRLPATVAHDFVYKPQRQMPRARWEAHPDLRPHLVELAAERLALPADFRDVRGWLHFTAEEIRLWSDRHASLGDFAIVVPVGKTSYTPNKEWGFARYREVVVGLPSLRWVQLGFAEHPALPSVVDLRGKTTLREMAWLLSRARFALCGEGFHNHLCGALGTPCFVVFSGFHYPEIARYATTVAITADTPPACSPCWLKSACPVPGKPCTGGITPASVIARVRAAFPDVFRS